MLRTPDITAAQVVAIVGAVIGVLIAGGLPISQDLQDNIIKLVTVVAPVLLGADAVIRHGRARGTMQK